MIALTTSLSVATRRMRAKPWAVETFCSLNPVGSTKWVSLIPSESTMRFIRRTNSSSGIPQVRTSALVAALSDDISEAWIRSRTVISSRERIRVRLECRTSSGTISITRSQSGMVCKNTIVVTSLVRLAMGRMRSGFFSKRTRLFASTT